MAEQENYTEEQAQKLLEEFMTGKAEPARGTPTPEPAVTPPAQDVKPEDKKEEEAPKEEQKQEVIPTPEPENKDAPPKQDEKKEEPKKEQKSPPEKDDPYAWIKDVPEALQERVLKEIQDKMQLKHRVDSDDGRVRSMQQKLLEANRVISELKVSPRKDSAATASPPPKTPEKWTQLAKDDPEMADAIEARVKSEVDAAVTSVKEDIAEFKKSAVDPLYEHEQQQYVAHEQAALEKAVPNYREVVSDPHFNMWLNTVAHKDVAEKALKSQNHLDAIDVLKAYSADMIRLGLASPPQEQKATPTTTPKEPANTAEADKVEAERQKKLSATADVKDRTPALGGQGKKTQFTVEEADEELARIWAEMKKKKT
jgi:hypothetical protein